MLYVLVAANLLTVEAERFSNTLEANTDLVRGRPTYRGGRPWAMVLAEAGGIADGP